jgi:uncharacterized membrane protein
MEVRNFIMSLQNRLWIFPALSLATIVVGQICSTSCAFIHGDILGFDLDLFGIVFYSMLILSFIIYKKMFPRDWVIKTMTAAVAAGIGAEIIFVRFQIQNDTYCPKCLISGFFLFAMFLIMIMARWVKPWFVVLSILFGAVFTSFTFNGSVIPSYAGEIGCPGFGNSKAKVEVIVYSDYFCPFCRKVEGQINDKLLKLKDKVKIRFVDVPIHAHSLEYAEVFLYTWFANGDNLETAIKVRETLFNAAEKGYDKRRVLSILNSQGIRYNEDKGRAKDIFRGFYNTSIRTNHINKTPSMVVVKGSERKTYVGMVDILNAFKEDI